jgi:type IV pilus assembly protein PilB
MSGILDALPQLSAEQRLLASQSSDPIAMVIQEEWLEPLELLRAGSLYFRVPWLQLSRYQPDPEVVNLLTEEQARRLRLVPLFRLQDHLYVAVGNPQNLQVQDFVAKLTGLVVEPVFALPKDIEDALNRWMLTSEKTTKVLADITARVQQDVIGEQATLLEDREAPTIKVVDHVLTQAIRLGASDIHLEPFPEKILLRYRIDGHLREFPAPSKSIFNAVISRIKISSGMDIAERRLPQDGRGSIEVDGNNYDLRVSIIPNLHGEGVVIRILNSHSIQLDLAALGFDPALLARYETILKRPYGVILVTGPTGSGKSTTLYATLRKISDISRKVITLEDPVEYQLAGITQIQVQPEIGYTFASGLKAILRHDPDTVLVGEIRDLESAQIAIRAALTGHQMFSTLHTNDAPQAVTRLADMGVPLYQILASLNGILAQRLVRRLCLRCKLPFHPEASSLAALGIEADSEGTFFGPRGCQECNNIGYKGRVAVHELLDFTPTIRRLPPEQAHAETIADIARQEGAFFSLKMGLANKVKQGLTSIEEALALVVEQ